MKEEIKLTDWDPDQWKDELAKKSWKDSGAKTLDEYIVYLAERERVFIDKRRAEGRVVL